MIYKLFRVSCEWCIAVVKLTKNKNMQQDSVHFWEKLKVQPEIRKMDLWVTFLFSSTAGIPEISLSCETFSTVRSHTPTRPQQYKYLYFSVFTLSQACCLAGTVWCNALFGILHVMLWLALRQLFLCDFSSLQWGPICILRSHQTRGWACLVKRTKSVSVLIVVWENQQPHIN